VKYDVQHYNLIKPVTLNHKFTAETKAPAVKAKNGTIVLNSNFDGAAETMLVPSVANCPLAEFEIALRNAKQEAEAAKINVYMDGWKLKAEFADQTDLPKAGSYKYTVTARFDEENVAKATVTVKVAATNPKVTVAKSVKLNSRIAETKTTEVKVAEGYEVTYIEVESLTEGDNIPEVRFEDGVLVASVNEETAKGKYKYRLTPAVKMAEDYCEKTKELAPINFTVDVVNAEPVLNVTAKGVIDTINFESEIVYTVTGGANFTFNPAEYKEYAEEYFVLAGPDAEKFEIFGISENAKGQIEVKVCKGYCDPWECEEECTVHTLSTKETYNIRLGAYTESLGRTVYSKDFKVKPKQSAVKTQVTGNTTIYQSANYGRLNIWRTSPVASRIENIEILEKGTTLPEGALHFETGEIDYGIWTIFYTVEDASLLKVNGSYKLALAVTPYGNATDKAPQTVNITLKVKR
ncbi:MAG: hypothetical protein IJD80_05055, partial [Oscillospiraceae bacterium]|nr:hypothetical protein [Oscillospiraceae bacterium]